MISSEVMKKGARHDERFIIIVSSIYPISADAKRRDFRLYPSAVISSSTCLLNLVRLGLLGVRTTKGLKTCRLLVVVANRITVNVVTSPLTTLTVIVLRCSHRGGLEGDLQTHTVRVVFVSNGYGLDGHRLAEVDLIQRRFGVDSRVRACHPGVRVDPSCCADGGCAECADGAVVKHNTGMRVTSKVPDTDANVSGTDCLVFERKATDGAVETGSSHFLTAWLEDTHVPAANASYGAGNDGGVCGWAFGVVVGAGG